MYVALFSSHCFLLTWLSVLFCWVCLQLQSPRKRRRVALVKRWGCCFFLLSCSPRGKDVLFDFVSCFFVSQPLFSFPCAVLLRVSSCFVAYFAWYAHYTFSSFLFRLSGSGTSSRKRSRAWDVQLIKFERASEIFNCVNQNRNKGDDRENNCKLSENSKEQTMKAALEYLGLGQQSSKKTEWIRPNLERTRENGGRKTKKTEKQHPDTEQSARKEKREKEKWTRWMNNQITVWKKEKRMETWSIQGERTNQRNK